MRKKARCALMRGLTVSVALALGACGRSDAGEDMQADRQTPAATQIIGSAAQPAAGGGVKALPTPTQPGLAASATKTPAPRGFADATPPLRTPQPSPAGTCPNGCAAPPQDCLIKGTLPDVDYKVFLLPGQPGYDAAQIDVQKGERWFCTIAEARAAGWMPSKVPLPAHAPAP